MRKVRRTRRTLQLIIAGIITTLLLVGMMGKRAKAQIPVMLIPANEPLFIEVVKQEEVSGTLTVIQTEEKEIEELVEKIVKTEAAWYPNYTRNDIVEIGDATYAEMMEYIDDANAELVVKATASVILHRMEAKRYYPNTPHEVLWQNYGKKGQQYATRTLKLIGNLDTPEKVYRWVEELLIDGPIGPKGLVFEDNSVHGDEVWLQYGKLYFCVSNEYN